MRITRTLVCLVAVAALVAAGCGRVSDAAREGTATQVVTAGFGAERLTEATARDGASALDAIRAATTVDTAFGGKFVASMFGRSSDPAGRRDWFYFANGIAPNHGAGEQMTRPGDRIWWDYRPWGDGPTIRAAVGSWPEPFVNGYPARPASVQADAPLDAVLRDAGAQVSEDPSPWRVIVGAHADLVARDPAWRRAARDPESAGLAARVTPTGITRLAADGRDQVAVPDGQAIAAVVLTSDTAEDGGAVLAVAGINGAAAQAAAARIASDPGVLRDRYAVVFDGAGAPVAWAGQPQP